MKYLLSTIVFLFVATAFGMECSDYSGLWRGTCYSSEGYQDTVRWQISQDECEKMIINGTKFEFGKQTASRSTQRGWSVNTYERLSWDKHFDALDYDIRLVGRDASGQNSIRGSGFGQLELIAEDLYFESNVDYVQRGNAGSRAWTEYRNCQLVRIR